MTEPKLDLVSGDISTGDASIIVDLALEEARVVAQDAGEPAQRKESPARALTHHRRADPETLGDVVQAKTDDQQVEELERTDRR